MPEKAVTLYERAVELRPNEPQWSLAVASSTQRIGNYHKTLQILRSTRDKFPDNIDCLRSLVRLCTDLGLKEANEFANELRRLEQTQYEGGDHRKGTARTGTVIIFSDLNSQLSYRFYRYWVFQDSILVAVAVDRV